MIVFIMACVRALGERLNDERRDSATSTPSG